MYIKCHFYDIIMLNFIYALMYYNGMNEQKISEALASINVWWNGSDVPVKIKKAEMRRKIFYDLSKNCLDTNNICCITGPRQVGKTTLMGQLIEYQIKEKKVNPKRIIYVPLDNELLVLNSETPETVLMDCMKVYLDYVLGEAPEKLSETIYIYLDEIQSLKDWEKHLKSYYDSYSKIKFIVSGSSRTKIHIGASESLVGRIQMRIVLPLKFTEFLELGYNDKLPQKMEFAANNLRNALKQSIESKSPASLNKQIAMLQIELSSELPKIKKTINQYLVKGGYPGVLEFGENYDKVLERLKTDLELTVFKDIHVIFKTRNSSEIMTLLFLVASSSGQKINYSSLANTTGIDMRTVTNYLSYTSLVSLTCESQIYKSSKYVQVEKANKAYLVDTGHMNTLLGRMTNDVLNEPSSGFIIQTAVFNHASRLRFYLTGHTEYDIFYWEDGNGKHEVDVIIEVKNMDSVLPIEVKSKSGEKGIASVRKFMDNHENAKWGIVITKDELKLEKNVLLIPLWAFLMMC